jgi:hypothetical protein
MQPSPDLAHSFRVHQDCETSRPPSRLISVAQLHTHPAQRADLAAVPAGVRLHLPVYSRDRPIRDNETAPAMLYYFHRRPVGPLLFSADVQWLARRYTRAILSSMLVRPLPQPLTVVQTLPLTSIHVLFLRAGNPVPAHPRCH